MIDGHEVIRRIDAAIAEIHSTRRRRRGPLKPGSLSLAAATERAAREIGLLIAREIVQKQIRQRRRPAAGRPEETAS